MDGALEAVGAGGAEGWGEEGDVPSARVSAKVDGHDATGPVLGGEVDDRESSGKVAAPVDGQNKVCPH